MTDELGRLYRQDEERFRSSYASTLEGINQTQLASKLVFSTHSLEKGLSHDNFEPGHGFHDAFLLTEMLNVYHDKGFDRSHLAYINTLSTLKLFYANHKNTKYIDKVNVILGDMVPFIEACNSEMGGNTTVSKKSKKSNSSKNFEELSEGRFAIRSYADAPVEKAAIKEVVRIATKTPTVCNRQAIKVYEMYDRKVIESVLAVQGGIKHYETPPVLLLVTADDSFYVGPNERNQGFVDGGLFAMSLLYALEYKGLAGCPLHAMLDEAGDYAVRGMLGIPESEKFITFMSAGHFKDINNVCKSFRYPVEQILVEKKTLKSFPEWTSQGETQAPVDVQNSLMDMIRKKIRIRTRIKAGLKTIKQKTRLRTRYRNLVSDIKYKKDQQKYASVDGALITLPGYYNYGNMVQRFALQHFLKKNGLNFISYAKDIQIEDKDKERLRYTSDFVERNIWRKQFDSRDRFKAYIVGSDQVWRKWGYDDIFDELGYYFLDFTKDFETNRIAYAASIGQDSLKDADYTEEYIPYAGELARKFSHVSMRELSGVDIVKKEWEVTATHVLDPTMLLEAEDYEKLIEAAPYDLNKPGELFTYCILTNEEKKAMIASISKDVGIKDNGIYLEKSDILRPVEEWLQNIRDAKLVVTDSFHGMVFCILFNTPFIVLESGTGGSARITTLLGKLGLEERYIVSDKVKNFKISDVEEIDWPKVNAKLEKLRAESAEWLLKAIASK